MSESVGAGVLAYPVLALGRQMAVMIFGRVIFADSEEARQPTGVYEDLLAIDRDGQSQQ